MTDCQKALISIINEFPCGQMSQARNLIYEAKKKAESRSSPFYNPIDPAQNARQELKQLRTKNRAQQTQIIRLKDQLKELRDKILFYQDQLKLNGDSEQEQTSKIISQMSAIPMIIQNKQMKQQISHIHQVNLSLNGKNRELQAQNRQIDSELKRCRTKLKQLEILQTIRSENFEKQLQNAKPVIVEENENFQILSNAIKKVIQFMRDKVISVSYEVFLSSARECQNQKKTNSYNIFVNYWNELRKSKHLGYLGLIQCMKSLSQVEKYLNFDKNEIFDINDSKYRDTLNEWVINTLTEIKYMKNGSGKIKEQKLFRLLGLLYRSRFPIKGEKYELDIDVKKHFQELASEQIFSMLAA